MAFFSGKRINFTGKNIIITGASRGIGREIALQLAEYGASLFLLSRSKEDLEKLSEQIKDSGTRCGFADVDIADDHSLKNAISMGTEFFSGRIDGLINNAGFSHPEYFEKTPLDLFRKTMEVNYLASVHTLVFARPFLHPGSFVSFTSSVAGYMGVFGFTSYAGSKFALIGFAESLRQEFALQKIQVSVLAPPDTDTPGFREENKSKPYETKELSANANLMSAEKVAKIFLQKLSKGKFLITANFESALFYRLHGMFPELVFKIMMGMIRKAARKKMT